LNVLSSIKEIDTQLFLYLNSKHNAFFDVIMFWASNKLIWIPLYLFFLYLAYKQVGKRVWLVALSALVLIVFSDQLSTQVFKNVFLRYRPCHNLLIQAQVHLNGGCGGTYGFVSSHAANTFALAMFLSLFFKNNIRYFGLFIFLWATCISYSRIYNGVHYPADVFVGAMVGMIVGYIVFIGYQVVNFRLDKK
jgi:undecaprenyl-diphosphatase